MIAIDISIFIVYNTPRKKRHPGWEEKETLTKQQIGVHLLIPSARAVLREIALFTSNDKEVDYVQRSGSFVFDCAWLLLCQSERFGNDMFCPGWGLDRFGDQVSINENREAVRDSCESKTSRLPTPSDSVIRGYLIFIIKI